MPGFFKRRLALPQRSDERIETERILAGARAVLAVSSLLAVYYDPAPPFRLNRLVYGLLLLYTGHALALLVILYRRREIPLRFSVVAHIADALWPGVIGLFTNGRKVRFSSTLPLPCWQRLFAGACGKRWLPWSQPLPPWQRRRSP